MITWVLSNLGFCGASELIPDDAVALSCLDLQDGFNPPEAICQKLSAVLQLLDEGKKVVVFCQAGLSRSPAVCAAVLSVRLRLELDDACRLIKTTVAPQINPSLDFMRSCREALKLLTGKFEKEFKEDGGMRQDQLTEVVVYYDGACEPRNPRGVATYGFVIYRGRQKIGEGRGLAAEPWSDGASNNVAEYAAMIRAFEWLIAHGYSGAEVLVRGDSQLSIRQMQGVYAVRAPRVAPLYAEAKRLVRNFEKVEFEWIPREENGEADLLSELALRDYWYSYKAKAASDISPRDIVHISALKFRVKGCLVDLEGPACECSDYVRSNRNPRLRIRLPCEHIIAAEKLLGLDWRPRENPARSGTTVKTAFASCRGGAK